MNTASGISANSGDKKKRRGATRFSIPLSPAPPDDSNNSSIAYLGAATPPRAYHTAISPTRTRQHFTRLELRVRGCSIGKSYSFGAYIRQRSLARPTSGGRYFECVWLCAHSTGRHSFPFQPRSRLLTVGLLRRSEAVKALQVQPREIHPTANQDHLIKNLGYYQKSSPPVAGDGARIAHTRGNSAIQNISEVSTFSPPQIRFQKSR